MQLTSQKTIRMLMQKHGVYFSKGLGQNFIINPHICPEIARLGGADRETGVLEIGPGIGVLTMELAKRSGKVVALELDRKLLPILAETLADFPNATVLHADVMKTDLHALIKEQFSGMNVVVCANLPYYITTPILMRLLETRLPVRTITVMVQKEVAQRVCAPMPSRESSPITAAVQYYCQVETVMQVSRGSFLPAPNVDSAVMRLQLRDQPAVSVSDEALFFSVVRAAFSQRRKTLVNSLSAGLAMEKLLLSNLLEQSGLSPTIRAEQLSLQQFADLSEHIRTRQ